jgi:RND family efflux transporter MFP subunit
MHFSEQRTTKLPGKVLLTSVLAICCGCSEKTTIADSPAPVRVTTVSNSDAVAGVRYSANVVANAQVNLAFKSGGYVDSITQRKGADGRVRPLEVGDAVASGEVLATVRQMDYTDRVEQAKAQVVQAKASFDKAHLDFERASNLFSADSLTKAQFDAAKSANDTNSAALANAEAALSQAQTALNDCTVRSPMNGWIVERDVEVGSLAGTGTTAFVIVDTHVVKVVFGVPDTIIQRIHLGDRQTITTISMPGLMSGRVTSISPSVDPKSRVFSVEVTIPNAQNKLKPGMIATLALGNERAQQSVTVVPLSAVVRSSKNPQSFSVFVLTESGGKVIAHEREVGVGQTIGNNIAVTQGLQTGEQVVSVGATEIHDGEQVHVLL